MAAEKFRVFISWSGEPSKSVAYVWTDLVNEIFDNAVAFMSEQAIGAGERGLAKLEAVLADSSFGIIVLTQKNQYSQWVNFEAGALSKGLGVSPVRVAPSLVDFDLKDDVQGPIHQFQANLLTEDGVAEILKEIATVVSAEEDAIKKRFRRAWADEYGSRFDEAKRATGEASVGAPEPESPGGTEPNRTEAMFDEVLNILKGLRVSDQSAAPQKANDPAPALRAALDALRVSYPGIEWSAGIDPKSGNVRGLRVSARGSETTQEFQDAVYGAINRTGLSVPPITFGRTAER